jgi:conserved oligomeric Golgi complex subunit 4
MLLRHIDAVEERSDQLLLRVQDSVRRRDALLQEIRQSVHAESELSAALEEIHHVQYRLMPQYVHRSAALARTVAANASLAERSSKRVKRLDALLQRVQATSAIVDAMKAMESDVAQVSAVLEAGNIEKTVELLRSYEEAQRVLMTASPAAAAAASAANAPTTTAEETDDNVESTAAEPNGFASPSPAAAMVSGTNPALVSDVMRKARESVHERLLGMIKDAVAVNDKLTIMKLTRLLAELGESATAAHMYSNWIADHTIAALAKLIDAEMKKMDDPAKVAMTHLALVSQCLDNVAAVFENDEEFTRDAFGAQGPLTLLAELHSRATARCVPVLSDFIERRKGVLAQLETHASTSAARSNHGNSSNSGGGVRWSGASSPLPVETGGRAASPPLSSATEASQQNAVVASTRRADQILEEISHMVSCGYIYLSFVQKKQSEYEGRLHKEAAAAAKGGVGEDGALSKSDDAAATILNGGTADANTSSADSLWKTRDNALLNSMQDILAFYVPLQNMYFTIAYDQALDLQTHAIRDAAKEAAAAAARVGGARGGAAGAAAGGGNGGEHANAALPTAASATTFMSGLQILYSVAASSADELLNSVGGAAGAGGTTTADQADVALFWYYTHNGQVTLPDDVFFVLRMAVHRAMNTKSAQICSAVIISAMDVVQSRLLPEIEKHTLVVSGVSNSSSSGGGAAARRRTTAAHGSFLTPGELHWTGAAYQTATYLQRMADELQQLSAVTFAANTRDVARFRELASDMRAVGRDLQERQIPSWLDSFADVCCDSVLPPHMERFAAVSYDMKEEVYYHYELNDAWVQACLMDLGAGLQYMHQHLTEAKLFDTLLTAMAKRVAKATSGVLLRKRFSLFGSLQVDKDVRALRTFFVEQAQNDLSPIRDAFAVLNLMVTLLLSDKPTDALEEATNTALTGEEKKKVLLARVEFRQEAVMALPL